MRPKPKRLRLVHAYQKHPDTKPKVVKAFDTRWKAAKEADPTLKHIKFRYDLASELLENDLLAEKTLEDKLREYIEADYEECLEDWQQSQIFEPSDDPEAIQECVSE